MNFFKRKFKKPLDSFNDYMDKKQRKIGKSPLKKCCIMLNGKTTLPTVQV